MVVEMKGKYPMMGPKKILVKLQEAYPEITWPATSTLGEVLKHYGWSYAGTSGATPVPPVHPYRTVPRPMRSGASTSRATFTRETEHVASH